MDVNQVDKNLLARVGRHLKEMATEHDTLAAAALNSDKYRPLKAKADRLHRDIRDLDALRKRANGNAGA